MRRLEQKMAAKRAKVEDLRAKQEEVNRNKRQYKQAEREKLQAQLVRTFMYISSVSKAYPLMFLHSLSDMYSSIIIWIRLYIFIYIYGV